MMKFARAIQAWVEKPGYQDFDDRQNSFYIQAGALVTILLATAVGVVYAIAGQLAYVILMVVDVLVHAAIIWLIRHGLLKRAAQFFLVFQLFFLTYGLLSGGGIHSLSSVLYPVILIFASLLLERKSFYLYCLLCIASVGFVVFAENQHLTLPYIPDQPNFPLFFSFSLMLVGSALPIRFITENLQISLRKARQNEQELLIQKEILDRVGQAVVAGLTNGTIFYWNKAASDYYGWQAEEALGKQYSEIVPASYSPEIGAEITAALRAGRVWSGELPVRKRDGTLLPTLSSLSPLHDRDGKMTGWVGIAADITERKQTEETLRESEDRFKSLFDYSVIGKSLTRLSGEVQVNQAFCNMVGYPSAELEHRKWQEITHPDDIELTQKEISLLLSGEKSVTHFTKRFIHKNGSVVWVDLSSTLRRAKDGKPLYLMSSLVDITERIKVEAALRESEARFHDFFSHSMDAMFLVDENSLIVEINPAAENLFQFKQDEVLGKPIWEFQLSRAPDNIRASVSTESLQALTEAAIRTGQGYWLNRTTESRVQLPDGQIRHVQQTSFVIPHGDKFRIASINRDVTEQKQAEALRAQAEAVMRTAAIRQRLHEFSQELLATVDMVEIFHLLRKIATDLVPHDVFHPYWVDEEAGLLVPADKPYQKKVSELFDPHWRIPLGEGIMGGVVRQDQAELVNDVHLDPRSVYQPGVREKIKQEHGIFLPIHDQGKVIGVLVLLRRNPPSFTRDEFELAQLFMSLAELALGNARLFAELEKRVLERTEQLAASEERYRLISTISSDYMFSTRLNEQGGMVLDWVAGAFEQITGYNFEEYVAYGGWRATLHPADLEQDAQDMAPLNQNRPATTEIRTLKKDGELRWVRVYAHPVWDAGKDRLVGIYGAVQDITERKLNEAREEHRRILLEKVILMGKTLTQATDLQQCYQEIHRSVQQGLDFDRVGLFLYDETTREVRGIVGTDRSGRLEDTTRNVDVANEGSTWKHTLENPLGIYHFTDLEAQHPTARYNEDVIGVREHVTVAAWAGEKPVAFLAVDNLLTQRGMSAEQIEALRLFAGYVGLAIQNARWSENLSQRVEERTAELAVANRELESLSYTIGHDLRSPIRAIVAYSQMLLDELPGRPGNDPENKLRLVNQVSIRMGRMVDEFLTFLRLGRLPIKKHVINPSQVVEKVIDSFKESLAGREVEFSVFPMPDCFADVNLLRDVFFHLVSNSLKFTAPRSPAFIEIGAIQSRGQNCYYVRDNGVGFDMKYADKLFGVFQRLHRDDEFEGIGIELAIVQRIIQRHGGRIWAEAEVDKGATFYFTLERDNLP